MELTTKEMEIALSEWLDITKNLVVPNVSWGFQIHECDLLVITKSGYAWEIEIKISKADLKKDLDKWHGHNDVKIRRLYFAIPDYMQSDMHLIPDRAGILIVRKTIDGYFKTFEARKPEQTLAVKMTAEQKFKVARLASLRMWTLKANLIKRGA